ncbi:MAG: sugar transferase [Verrucomicrobiota bacterium]|nr:sugar transferase [Verrucomicrobiota bacterium]
MKRFIDIIVSTSLIILLTPVIIGLYAIQLITFGRPVFFSQKRGGYHGRPFRIFKFRTMHLGHEADAERITRWGHFLRSSSLDEIPELWNVLKGDMSLVGPRPLPIQYLERYSPEQKRRHDVVPGLTGWAQINGRNGLTWEKQFELDCWYIDHHSCLLDLKIMAITVYIVIGRKNISAPGSATRSEFFGTNSPRNKSL